MYIVHTLLQYYITYVVPMPGVVIGTYLVLLLIKFGGKVLEFEPSWWIQKGSKFGFCMDLGLGVFTFQTAFPAVLNHNLSSVKLQPLTQPTTKHI